jgi:hypothetical protein
MPHRRQLGHATESLSSTTGGSNVWRPRFGDDAAGRVAPPPLSKRTILGWVGSRGQWGGEAVEHERRTLPGIRGVSLHSGQRKRRLEETEGHAADFL